MRDALEKRIEKIEGECKSLTAMLVGLNPSQFSFEAALSRVMAFVSNPHAMWVTGDYKHKQMVQKLDFAKPVVYDPFKGIGTAEISLPFKVLQYFSGKKVSMVEAAPSYTNWAGLWFQ